MEIITKKCNVCGQEIQGTKESEVEHNLTIHRMTHRKVKKNGESREAADEGKV